MLIRLLSSLAPSCHWYNMDGTNSLALALQFQACNPLVMLLKCNKANPILFLSKLSICTPSWIHGCCFSHTPNLIILCWCETKVKTKESSWHLSLSVQEIHLPFLINKEGGIIKSVQQNILWDTTLLLLKRDLSRELWTLVATSCTSFLDLCKSMLVLLEGINTHLADGLRLTQFHHA